MRIPLLMLVGPLSLSLAAQCTFTPTITPASPVLCPGDTVLLSTQSYGSYQWYRDGQPLPGDTLPVLPVGYADVGSAFTVLATLDGCAELSVPVLVDGYVFLPPYAISAGDPSTPDDQGNLRNCVGDTVLLILGAPNTVNVQWTLNGMPIPGATDDTLVVTGTGSYSASAAPVICPQSIRSLGVNIDLTFVPPTVPVVVPNGTELCAAPTGTAYQWSLDGVVIPGANTACITPSGPGGYTVQVTYNEPCQVPSAPYLITGIADEPGAGALQLFPNPTRGAVRVSRGQGVLSGNWSLVDVQGREVLAGRFRGFGDEWLDLAGLPAGRYWLRPELGADWAPAAISVID